MGPAWPGQALVHTFCRQAWAHAYWSLSGMQYIHLVCVATRITAGLMAGRTLRTSYGMHLEVKPQM